MRVLVIETDRHAADDAIAALGAAGHEVVRCHDPHQAAFPCNALRDDRACPLDGGGGVDVVLTVRAHPHPRPSAFEDGVTCALRRHIPLVVAGRSALNPFQHWTADVADDDDVVTACDRAAAAPIAALSEPATAEVRRLLDVHGVEGGDTAQAVVHRRRERLVASLDLPPVPASVAEMAAVRVAGVLRAADPTAEIVDVTTA
jgi:hypothetical protein